MAIDVLYEADVLERSPTEVLDEWRAADRALPAYAVELVEGVAASQRDIDALLASRAEGWAVYRMAVVDRTILRVASFELKNGIPAAVAINEAVSMAGELSTEDSGRFINGVLGRIARDDHTTDDQGSEGSRPGPPGS